MIRALVLLALLQQAPAPQPAAPAPGAPTAPITPAELAAPVASIAPYSGTLAQGLTELQTLARAGKNDEALALADALLAPNTLLRWKLEGEREPGWSFKTVLARCATPVADLLGWSGRTSEERAAIEYARGVVHAGAGDRPAADEAFQHARADGRDELRLASIYNLGSLALEQGEEWRQKIPEISGQKPAPPPPPAAGKGKAEKEPDPLQEARKAYLAARERLIERLRAQWNDADTRADVELVQRRLKQLDEIEKKRKQQEQEQKDKDKQKQDQNDKDKQKSDKQDPDPKKQDPEKQDQPPDPKDGDPNKQDEKPPEPPKPEDKPEGEEKQEEAQPAKPQEIQLSKEEMTRLLDKLQQLEEQAEKLRQQIHQSRKVSVKKDW